MKRTMMILVGLVTGILIAATAYAGDSATIQIGCTIPAIPGVNVPLLAQDQQAATPETQEPEETVLVKRSEKDQDAPILLAERKTSSGSVQTIYYR